MPQAVADKLAPLSRRQLFFNSIWSLIGDATPIFFALPSIPLLIYLIGAERFGVLSIIWVAIGYFNLFDFGLSRSVTHFAAKSIGEGRPEDVPEIFWSSLAVILPIGVLISIAIMLGSIPLAGYIKTTAVDVQETAAALRWLAVGIPLVMATVGLKGLLQAGHAFRAISQIQIPLGIVTYLVPALIAWMGYTRLDHLTVALVVGRVLICGWYFWAASRLFPDIVKLAVSMKRLRSMLGYSGWIAVSNFVGPMMVYFDRFFIGVYFGAAAAAYYSAPFDTVTRTGLFAASIATVVFPAVAYMGANEYRQVAILMEKAQLLIAACILPIYLFLSAFAADLLRLWINDEFSMVGAVPAALLCAGMFANSVARIPHAVLQGRGRADLTGKAHLVELPLYFFLLFVLAANYGLVGVAAAWLIRTILDYAFLTFISEKVMTNHIIKSPYVFVLCMSICMLIAYIHFLPLLFKILLLIIASVICVAVLLRAGMVGMLLHRRAV